MSTGSSLSLKALQRQCKAAGLDAKGTRSTLVKRLQTWAADPPEGGEEMDFEAIMATETEAGDEGEMERAAKDVPGEALEVDELSVEDVGGRLFVGNRRRLRYTGLSERTRVLEEQVPALQDRIVTLEAEGGARQQSNDFAGRISSCGTGL